MKQRAEETEEGEKEDEKEGKDALTSAEKEHFTYWKEMGKGRRRELLQTRFIRRQRLPSSQRDMGN